MNPIVEVVVLLQFLAQGRPKVFAALTNLFVSFLH